MSATDVTPPQPDGLETIVTTLLDGLTGDPFTDLQHLGLAQQRLKAYIQRDDYQDANTVLEGVRNYLNALVELQGRNWGKSVEYFQKAESLLSQSGKFASMGRGLLDATAPDNLFTMGCLAFQAQDMVRATALITNAAQRAEYFAKNYSQEGEAAHTLYLGLAHYQRAQLKFFKSINDLSIFDFSAEDPTEDVGRDAVEACRLLSQIELNPLQQNVLTMSTVIFHALPAMATVSRIVHALLEGRPTPPANYAEMHRSLKSAAHAAAEAGERGVEVLRVCERFKSILANVQGFDTTPSPAVDQGVRVFVIMSYAKESEVVAQAYREVFENDPYWFQVVLAKDETIQANLFENIKKHMHNSHAFIADITGLKPNIMLELGMTLNDVRTRPVLVFQCEGNAATPADLQGRLYIEYKMPPADTAQRAQALADQIRPAVRAVQEIEDLLNHRQARYLSEIYINQLMETARFLAKDRSMQLNAGQTQRLQMAFGTVEQLEASKPDQLEKAGLSPYLARSVADAVKWQSQKAANA